MASKRARSRAFSGTLDDKDDDAGGSALSDAPEVPGSEDVWVAGHPAFRPRVHRPVRRGDSTLGNGTSADTNAYRSGSAGNGGGLPAGDGFDVCHWWSRPGSSAAEAGEARGGTRGATSPAGRVLPGRLGDCWPPADPAQPSPELREDGMFLLPPGTLLW